MVHLNTITRAAKQKLRAEKLGAEADAAIAYCESLTDGIKNELSRPSVKREHPLG